ncbi:MAG: isopeptide-forming domain-containing fimbrial protein [Thermodesulfobacteriota bacterium]
MSTNFSFDNNDPTPYLVIFDNVLHTGQMACNTVAGHTIWFVNGSSSAIQEGCQNLLIPVEKIVKQSPAPSATIGIPFTYTLTIPVLFDAGTGAVINSSGSLNDLHSIILTDDLNATGAALTYVGHNAYWEESGTPVAPVFTNAGGALTFDFNNLPIIPAEQQIVLEITVVLDDLPANAPGTVFTNTAKWSFGRLIDGVFYEPLPGEWGISESMIIAVPDLVVTKTSSETALNLGDTITYYIDLQNMGASDAWNTTILDEIPAEMCDYDPSTAPGFSVQIFAADGITPVSGLLTQGADYSVLYTDTPPCQLSLTMVSAAAVIGPSQHMVVTYQSQLNADVTQDGLALTNFAGATQWFSGNSSFPGRRQYDRTLTDGTPGLEDFQDSETVTTALAGYYFQKTVSNINSGMDPAATAAPGDRLRYRVRLFNVDQTINGISISDQLDPASFDLATFDMVIPPPVGAIYNYNTGTGLLEINGDGNPLNVAVDDELVFEFEITLRTTLNSNTVVENQAALEATGITALSDDPYINGIAAPGDPADPTTVIIQAPGPLLKENIQGSATIGEQFNYQIRVPATPIAVPLYDVRILDDLSLPNADMNFVSATVVSGGVWGLSNTGNATNLVIEDAATGIDIPPNGQAVINITVELQNTMPNQSGLLFANNASYTYNRMNGNNGTQMAGGTGGTPDMTIVEPDLSAVKSVSFVSPASKMPGDPATVGDVLEYQITITNNGSSTAYDTNIVDTLPTNLSLVPGSAIAQINGVDVTGFVSIPTAFPGGSLAWGRENGDFTLDIPVGQILVMTYQVTLEAVAGTDIENSVYVDWTSLDGGSLTERTGGGCPASDPLNDYCFGPASISIATIDNTSMAKVVFEDTYSEIPPSTADPVIRVGDTASYDLTLSLQEYTTGNVVVEDDLPQGMALQSFTIIGGANFNYTLAAQPAAGATGTLRWEFGDITNTPSNDGTPVDALVIRYVAGVVIDAPPVGVDYATSIQRSNLARLSYTGGDPVVHSGRLTATETVEVRQPQMGAISKIDQGTGRIGTGVAWDPYQVNIATDVMNFRLSSCNDGLAPAYGVVITDQLAPQFDESHLAVNQPVVTIGTTILNSGADYTITLPARGGEMRISLLDSAPINPGECLFVDYDIGFHTDLAISTSWSNQARLVEYRSLPLSRPGRIYSPGDLAGVWMANLVSDEQLLKTLVSPEEATVGDEVVYEIRVPAVPINTAMDNVVVVDSLHPALEYLSASAVDAGGTAVTLTDSSVAPGDVRLEISNIPAGEQVIITLRTRVVNNDQANAGASIVNTASYTYANMPAGLDTASTSAPVTIVEPSLAIAKTVTNASNPGVPPSAGDILRYSLSLIADGGATGDNFSDAFDILIEDTLSLGLAYQGGTTLVDGMGNTIADPIVSGDGVNTAQALIWSSADANADIDVAEGTVVTVTYDVRVLAGVQAGQELTNSAITQWTGLDGDSALERTGTGTPAVNDYFAGPATQTATTRLEVSFIKTVVNATTGEDPGANAQPGDTLRYTLVLTNQSIVALTNTAVVDDLAAQFAPGSLQIISVSDNNADTTNTDDMGGANGTGIVDIRNLALDAQGGADDTVTIVFEARLAAVIQSGLTVLNHAQLTADNLASAISNQTATLISSSPAFEIWKTSQDMTGDPDDLVAGDTLRYTITVKNVGSENTINTILRDQIPIHTTYAPGTTHLNGVPVADPSPGVSPLQSGLLINAPENATTGYMRADSTATSTNVAFITFEVVIDSDVVDGTIIANQGFVNADGQGSGLMPQEPSDDPATAIEDDPTRNVVGNFPLVDAHKTVQLSEDHNGDGFVDPGDELRYTIVISNMGAAPATGVVITDAVPADTTYIPDSVYLNNLPVGRPDGGNSPLLAGIDVSSSDLTPPLPGSGNGTLSIGATAVVTFDVRVDTGVPPATIISNQGVVSTSEALDEPTDADGIDANGDQPTQIVVGDEQLLNIVKEVFIVGGGTATPGSELEYVIRVNNIGSRPATQVVVTDDLSSMAGLVRYIPGSASLNGSPVGVSYSGTVLSADYASQYGSLPTGSSVVVRFRVQIDPSVPIGTTLTNTGVVRWNNPAQTETAAVSLDVGGTPSSATFNGVVWHDANLNKLDEGNESHLEGWLVELYRNNQLLATVRTGAEGTYRLAGVAPNAGSTEFYELRFYAAGARPNAPSLGYADSVFTNGPQRISGITVTSGGILMNLNLPIWPNGTVYNSITRVPVSGASLSLVNALTGAAIPSLCFDDPLQQTQITAQDGFYKFDLNFSDAACPPGGTYFIEVTPPASGYMAAQSQVIPPASNAATSPFSVPACPGTVSDAVPATLDYCEVTPYAGVPPVSVQPRTAGTVYHLHLVLDDASVPGQSQVFNNPIPIDPVLDGAVAITKTSSLINVTRGELVPYTITVNNVYGVPLYDISVVDSFPAGFKYVSGSSRLNNNPLEPQINGQELVWENLELQVNDLLTFQMLLVVGSGVSEGEYVNSAYVLNSAIGTRISGEATATVQVVPDPDIDCTDVIGKAFDDRNLNGWQDSGELGLAGVRVVTARGLIATADKHGRFHITCAAVPDQDRGSNFILKLDERSLPSGYRLTTENPRVQRATRGKMLRFNFGATIHRVVRMDIADGVFEPDSSAMRLQWKPRISMLIEELHKAPSILRLSYLADVERKGLVKKRMAALKKEIGRKWHQSDGQYRLTIETEVFWRRGAPVTDR